jgi:hypothetical protein
LIWGKHSSGKALQSGKPSVFSHLFKANLEDYSAHNNHFRALSNHQAERTINRRPG